MGPVPFEVDRAAVCDSVPKMGLVN
jgi:hypothetical protein